MMKKYGKSFGASCLSAFAMVLFVLGTGQALAASHTYVCSDLSSFGTASCSGDVFSTPGVDEAGFSGSTIVFDFGNSGAGQTVYISATVSGLTNQAVVTCTDNVAVDCTGSINGVYTNLPSGVTSELPITVPAGFANGGTLILYNRPTPGTFGAWNISNLCLDNDGTSCSASPPPPTPTGTSTVPCVTAPSSTACIVQVVDYPSLDLFLGIVLLCTTFIFTVWFFTGIVRR